MKIASTARKQAFNNSTLREFSSLKRVQMKTTTSNKIVNAKTTLAIHRVDSVSGRRRDRERDKKRDVERDIKRDAEQDTERESERSSDRERRDREREQAAMLKET